MKHLTSACLALLGLCSAPAATLAAGAAPSLPSYPETFQLQALAMVPYIPVPTSGHDHAARLQLSVLANKQVPVPQAKPMRYALATPET